MCSKCSVNFKMQTHCNADRDRQEVTSKSIMVCDQESPVVPVIYYEEDGQESDPIRLMMLSKNQ